MDNLKETSGYGKLEDEALHRTLVRIRFGRGYGPVVRDCGVMNDIITSDTSIFNELVP
jgi:hypothetical protein